MPSKLYCELRLMFGDFNEAAQPKTSLGKYSIESNDVAVQMRLHWIAYLRLLLGSPYTFVYVRRQSFFYAYFRQLSLKSKYEKNFIFTVYCRLYYYISPTIAQWKPALKGARNAPIWREELNKSQSNAIEYQSNAIEF